MQTLYKRTKTGAIQYWKVSIENDTIIKESGQLGGKPIIHTEVVSPKNIGRSNETTPLQQAESQAKSDWAAKHDQGYKSLEDLGIYNSNEGKGPNRYSTSTSHITDNLAELLELQLPKFNTGQNNVPLPMLAKAVNWDKVTYPCYIQPKLDGVRILMVWTGNSLTFLSRSGKPYTTFDHIAADVLKYIRESNPAPFILDGEGYSDSLNFQQIVAAVKKQRPDSLKLHFRAYDVVSDRNQEDRWTETVQIVDAIASPLIWPVSTFLVTSKEEVMENHDKWVSEGNEGAMIRLRDGHYGQGQRSSHLLKVKQFDEAEFQFDHWEFGQRREDLIAVCHTHGIGGVEFRAKMIGTVAEKEELYVKWNGKTGQLTVKYFGLTEDSIPRFPIGKSFRDY